MTIRDFSYRQTDGLSSTVIVIQWRMM